MLMKNIIKTIGRLFGHHPVKKDKHSLSAKSVGEVVTEELDILWSVVRETEAGGEEAETTCSERIIDSYRKLKSLYSDEELDSVYAWSRYVKIATYSVKEPIKDLVDYVHGGNYISVTKRLSDLKQSFNKKEKTIALENLERFSDIVYHRIVDEIDPYDQPVCLELGKTAQKRKNYQEARKWFTRITETDRPFNGVTSLIACYEAETKDLLALCAGNSSDKVEIMKKVKMLNREQFDLFSKWRDIMEEHIKTADISGQFKYDYMTLMTGFARFERNRDHYDSAYDLLQIIPESYPDIHRKYMELAMLYQFRPSRNPYYSLSKAIEMFNVANDIIEGEAKEGLISGKSKKSILMPWANAYFKSGQYDKASEVCNKVLLIDSKEHRAIALLDRIASLAS